MFKIEITASTAIELGEKIADLMVQFGATTTAPVVAAGNVEPERPKRAARGKTTGSSENGTDSPPTPTDQAALSTSRLEPADAGNDTAAAGTSAASDTAGTSPDAGSTSSTSTTATSAASLSDAPASATRDDAMTAAVKFSTLSPAQGGGADALEAVLKHFGALDGETPRFSKLTEAQYGDFIAEMQRRESAASKSNALS